MSLYGRLEQRVSLPGDNETLRSQKTLSILLILAGSLFTCINALAYWTLGMRTASLIYMGLVIFLLIGAFLVLIFPRLWLPVGYLVVLGTIAFNISAHLFTGGFQFGLEAAIWTMLGPIVASLFFSPRLTLVALLFYISAILLAAFLDPTARSLAPEVPLEPRMRIAVGNLILMGIFVTAACLYLLRRVEYYRHRADELLLNMLPAPIAARMKTGQKTIADAYQNVTVLFADMMGSTPLFAELAPAEAVDWLNEVFSMFDELVERYGLEKIRTIGDNYMVAAGVPVPRADHARVMANFALALQRGLQEIPARGGKRMSFRVGINSGPLVAGVIGRTKYQYDLWGNTVNIASRMESHGEPGKVHVSASTYALIKDDFECAGRGSIPIKGSGLMETWYVLAPRSGS